MPFPLDGKNKALYEMKRGFRLIFQAGGSAFFRSAALFPVVGSVEVSGRFIDRLTKVKNGPKSSPQSTMPFGIGILSLMWNGHGMMVRRDLCGNSSFVGVLS